MLKCAAFILATIKQVNLTWVNYTYEIDDQYKGRETSLGHVVHTVRTGTLSLSCFECSFTVQQNGVGRDNICYYSVKTKQTWPVNLDQIVLPV